MSLIIEKSNMDRVSRNIYVGNSSDSRYLLDGTGINPNGITAVLNVAQDLDLVNKSDLKYLHVKLIDGPGNSEETFSQAVAALHQLLADGHTVLVHCHEGISRSPTVVATVLAQIHAYTIEQAFIIIARFRPQIFPKEALIAMARKLVKR